MPGTDQRRGHRPVNLFDGDRHQQMVSPCPVNLKVTAQQPLLAEANLCQHGATGRILRAHGGLDSMQHDRTEAVVETQRQRSGGHPSASGRAWYPIADPGRPQGPVGDIDRWSTGRRTAHPARSRTAACGRCEPPNADPNTPPARQQPCAGRSTRRPRWAPTAQDVHGRPTGSGSNARRHASAPAAAESRLPRPAAARRPSAIPDAGDSSAISSPESPWFGSAVLSQEGDIRDLTRANLLGPGGNHNQTVRFGKRREQVR